MSFIFLGNQSSQRTALQRPQRLAAVKGAADDRSKKGQYFVINGGFILISSVADPSIMPTDAGRLGSMLLLSSMTQHNADAALKSFIFSFFIEDHDTLLANRSAECSLQ